MLSSITSLILVIGAVLATLTVVCLMMRKQIFGFYLNMVKRHGLGKTSEEAVFTYPLF